MRRCGVRAAPTRACASFCPTLVQLPPVTGCSRPTSAELPQGCDQGERHATAPLGPDCGPCQGEGREFESRRPLQETAGRAPFRGRLIRGPGAVCQSNANRRGGGVVAFRVMRSIACGPYCSATRRSQPRGVIPAAVQARARRSS